MVAVYKALRPMIKQTILKDGSVEIGYEDGSTRTISIIQHFYELYLTRELMPHEFVRYKDPSKRGLDLKGIELMVRHPDWPEVKDEAEVAQPLPKIYRTETELHSHIGRKSIRVFTAIGVSKRTPWARFVFEKAIGRMLTKDETVDHIDEDKFNEDISNLQILSLKKNIGKNRVKRGHNVGDLQYANYNCSQCGTGFRRLIRKANRSEEKFCSKSCGAMFNNKRQFAHLDKIVKIPCSCCGKVFEKDGIRYRYDIKKGQKFFFCTPACMGKMSNKTRVNKKAEIGCYDCLWCKKEIHRDKKVVENKLRKGAAGVFCDTSCSARYINTNIIRKMKAT